MGVVTVRHYQASRLPEDLRAGLPDDALVSVTVEEEMRRRPPVSPEELKAQIESVQRMRKHQVTTEEAVKRIRDLRDEWED